MKSRGFASPSGLRIQKDSSRRRRMGLRRPGAFAAFAAVVLLSLAAPSWAQSGRDIMARVQERQESSSAAMRVSMHIFDRPDSTESRDLYLQTYSRGESESYSEFVAPRSISGLRILDLDGDIRVYFPSTGRVRLISGSQRGGSIGGVGGDFSYEDMGGGSLLDDYRFTVERADAAHYLIRGVPTDPESSYAYLLFRVLRDRLVVDRVEYYTARYGHEKTMTAEEFQTIQDRDVATVITMENHRKLQRTVLRIHQVKFDIQLDERYFNPSRFYR